MYVPDIFAAALVLAVVLAAILGPESAMFQGTMGPGGAAWVKSTMPNS